jgi:DNA-binding MarR family transcriptional regulator
VTEPDAPRRLTLLYQVWLLEVASSRLMRATLAGTGMRGEEYGLFSYLYANGPRTLTRAAHDLGHPVTTLSTLLAPWVESGDIVRRPHPSDGRARLLELSPAGRTRLEAVIPVFTAAYETLLRALDVRQADIEAMYETLDLLRTTVDRTVELIELETAGTPTHDERGGGHPVATDGKDRLNR